MNRQYVLMAQQVAHHTFNVGVKGSSPFRYTIKNLDKCTYGATGSAPHF